MKPRKWNEVCRFIGVPVMMIVFIVIAVLYYMCPTSAELEHHYAAYNKAEEALRGRLTNASSASLSGYVNSSVEGDGGTYCVTLYVDAPNAVGDAVRTYWYMKPVRQDDGLYEIEYAAKMTERAACQKSTFKWPIQKDTLFHLLIFGAIVIIAVLELSPIWDKKESATTEGLTCK